jgi:hypothetical protein
VLDSCTLPGVRFKRQRRSDDVERPLIHGGIFDPVASLWPVDDLSDVLAVGEPLGELVGTWRERELPERLDLDELLGRDGRIVDGELDVEPVCQVDDDRGLTRNRFGSWWRGEPLDGNVAWGGLFLVKRERPTHSDHAADRGQGHEQPDPPRGPFRDGVRIDGLVGFVGKLNRGITARHASIMAAITAYPGIAGRRTTLDV